MPFESLCADAPEEEALPPVPTDLNIKSGIFTDHPWDIWHWLVLDVLSFSLTELDPSVFVLTHSNFVNSLLESSCGASRPMSGNLNLVNAPEMQSNAFLCLRWKLLPIHSQVFLVYKPNSLDNHGK